MARSRICLVVSGRTRLSPIGSSFGFGRIALALQGALALSGCEFSPPALPPALVAIGGSCAANAECASNLCSSGVCVAAIPDGPRRHVPAIGGLSTNGAHTHVGRVGVAGVTAAVQR